MPTADVSLNLATVRKQWSMREAVAAAARHGFAGVAPWREMVQELGIADSAKLFRDIGLRVTGYCRAGLFPAADAAGRLAAIDDNKRAIDEAAAIGAENLVMIGGGLPQGIRCLDTARILFADGIAAVLPHARAAKVPLALEPMHPMYAADRGCITTLAEMTDLCEDLGDGLGIAVDTYHVWWDPHLGREIARAGSRIIAHHICDWLVPTRHLLTDRGMMGDGVIDFPAIRRMVEAAGYHGIQEVEIFSEDWWARPGDEVLSVVMERFRTVCQATP